MVLCVILCGTLCLFFLVQLFFHRVSQSGFLAVRLITNYESAIRRHFSEFWPLTFRRGEHAASDSCPPRLWCARVVDLAAHRFPLTAYCSLFTPSPTKPHIQLSMLSILALVENGLRYGHKFYSRILCASEY